MKIIKNKIIITKTKQAKEQTRKNMNLTYEEETIPGVPGDWAYPTPKHSTKMGYVENSKSFRQS